MTQLQSLIPTALFFILLLTLGFISSYRANRAAHFKREYFLGSQSLGGVVLALTLVATYGSVSSFVSGPGIAWNLGYGWVVFAAPQIITGFLILGLLGKRMTVLAGRTGSLTVVDLIFERFRSKTLSLILAVMLIIFFIAMTVGQFIGGAQIFASLTGLDYSYGLILFALVTVLYSSGGFRAVALTDAVCAFLMLTGMFTLGWIILSEAGGMQGAAEKLSRINIDESTGISKNLLFDAGGALPLTLLFSSWILVGFATVGLPQSLVRCMSYRSSKDLHKAMIIATLVCGALMIGMTMLGVLSRAVISDMPAGGTDRVIPDLITGKMHPLLAGLTILGPLAATMSTVSSLLIAAASAIVRDMFKALSTDDDKKQQSTAQEDDTPTASAGKNTLTYHEKIIVRGSTLAIGLLSIIMALYPADIVVWINMFAFGGLESAFVWPIILGLFSMRTNLCGIYCSIGASIGVYATLSIFKISILSFHAIVPALTAGLIAAVIGNIIGSRYLKQSLSQECKDIFFPHR